MFMCFYVNLVLGAACYSMFSAFTEVAGLEGVGDFRPEMLGLALASTAGEASPFGVRLDSDALAPFRDLELEGPGGMLVKFCHLYLPHRSAPGRSWIILAMVG
jgi:hypothetical protein